MRVVRFHEYGDPSVLRSEEVSTPSPSARQLLIKVNAAGVSYSDVLKRRDQYPLKQPLPITPGFAVAGLVESVGADVERFKKGDRVFGLPTTGGYAEYALLEDALAFSLPQSVPFAEATALPGQALTVVLMLDDIDFKPGQSVAVTAAAGGVGSMAAQIAKSRGASGVFGITGGASKLAGLAATGYDGGVSTDDPDWPIRLIEMSAGGVDVFLDSVGGDVFAGGLKVLKPRGAAVCFGSAGGRPVDLNPLDLMTKNQSVHGFSIGPYLFQPEAMRRGLDFLLRSFEDGKLAIPVRCYPLADAAQANRDMESRLSSGKLVLIP
jgi:NADPH:quinone reductase